MTDRDSRRRALGAARRGDHDSTTDATRMAKPDLRGRSQGDRQERSG